MEGSAAPEFDDFVEKVVTDPSQPPDVVVLSGFVGRSADEGHIRVYADPSLASWVDVPADAVRHTARLTPEQSPLGGSLLWVAAAAPLRTPAQQPAQPVAADFLRGAIQTELGAVAQPGVPAPTVQTLATICTQLCAHTQQFGCPDTSTCTPTSLLGCPRTSTCPPTHLPGCPNTKTCTPPTLADGCPSTSTCPPPTHLLGCPSTSTCGPRPTLGIACTVVGCGKDLTTTIHPTIWTQLCGVTSQLGCPSTSTCPPQTVQLGCPSTSTCPPKTVQLGCPSTSTCPPQTAALGCPSTSTCPPTQTIATLHPSVICATAICVTQLC